jgi:hypothetical protein
MKKLTIMIALLLVVALATPALGASFPDVPSNHWAYEAINKLVAAGVIEGYPDGTYKGQRNMTRYEMAMIISRALDNINEQQAEMLERIDSMGEEKAGLTTEQAQDVTAIVKALIQKNMPEETEEVVMPENLTEEQINEVANLIEALTFEYRPELKVLGSDIEDLQWDVNDVRDRVRALEQATPVISFSGSYDVDFTMIETEGTAIVPDDEQDAEDFFNATNYNYTAGEYYFEDPYSVSSGYYLEQLDSDTFNETDEAEEDPDFRIADGEDYYEDELEFVNSLDLNMTLNKGPVTADLDLTASANYFGEDDENGFELDDLSGTVTTPDFTATVGDDQVVTFKDYLFDEATVDGVLATTKNHTFFVSRAFDEDKVADYAGTEEKDFSGVDSNSEGYYGTVYGAEDDYYFVDRPYLRAGASMNFDLMLPVNVLVGYEYSGADTFDVIPSVDLDEVKNALVAVATEAEFAGMNVTADLATSLLDDNDDDYLFRLGASTELDMFDIAFNYEKTQNMTAIVGEADDNEGFDVKVGGTLAMVDGSVYYEDYNDYNLTTIKLAVPEGNLSFAGVAVDGSFELTTDSDEGHDEYRNINASTTMLGINLAYTYDYNADNDIWDPEVDMLDNGQTDNASTGDPDYWYEEEDDDLNLHTLDASYAVSEMLTVGVTSEFEKDIDSDATDIVWADEFENPNTLYANYADGPLTAGLEYELDKGAVATARYAAEYYEVGAEVNFNNDDEADNETIIDGKVMSPVYTVWGVDMSGEAMMKRNIDTEEQDLGVMLNASKDVNQRLALSAGLEYGDKEIDVDYAGVKLAANAGLEYMITDDVTANADYEYLDWEGDTNGNYTAQKATMGVNVAF